MPPRTIARHPRPASGQPEDRPICNLYAQTSNQAAIRELARAMDDATGNLPPMPGIYPDYAAPIVRHAQSGGGRELTLARWGMPSPARALEGKKTDKGVTNIRNVASSHWRRWLGIEHRCLVPFTSFSENEHSPDGIRPVWFTLGEDQPLALFAGVWTRWSSVRKMREGEIEADLFGFLTCPPNAEVGAVHPKAMPVILRTPDELDQWMTAPTPEAMALQRPLPDGALTIIAREDRADAT